mgnify:CR=1 FL=1
MNNCPCFLENLNTKQREICISPKNYVLTACPGSGKTRLITYRLAYLQWKYSNSRKYNIAITYTNRAAEEIEHRLDKMGIDLSSVWSGTIHQFCMHFIIRPYSMYSKYLKNGYKIIDEYVSNAYCQEISKKLGIDYGYEDPLTFPEIKVEYYRKLYSNREIDFNLILKLSLNLLRENTFIAENIAPIIRSVHIDEFQDTNELQYEILAEIVKYNKEINVIFVGDINQGIFGSLGGEAKKAEELTNLFQIDFQEDTLSGCYRSTNRIIDFYTNFEIAKTGTHSLSLKKDLPGIIKYNTLISKDNIVKEIKSIIEEQIAQGVLNNEICIVAPQWYTIYSVANALKAEMPTFNFDAPDISAFKYDPLNPFYLLAKLLFTKPGNRVQIRKKIASEILNILRNDYQICIDDLFDNYSLLKIVNSCINNTEDGIEFYKQSIFKILNAMNVSLINEKRLQKLFLDFMDKCNNRIKKYSLPTNYDALCKCFMEKSGIVINTIHGIKGEEYTTVIAFGLLNGMLPNWSYIIQNSKKQLRTNETNKLLYVLASRAKENLFLFSEKGYLTKSQNEYTPTDELYNVQFNYD